MNAPHAPDRPRDEVEVEGDESTLPEHIREKHRPVLESGYRLTPRDLSEIARAVAEDFVEAFQRQPDREEGAKLASDAMEPPELQELIARACRQRRECEGARKRLDATTRALLLMMASWQEEEADDGEGERSEEARA